MEYKNIVIMTLMSFIVSYYFTMTILLRANKTHNRNKLYQGLLMASWMVAIMFMFEPMHISILIFAVIGIIIFSYFIYFQIGINDVQFLLSMIEHHQMAIDMVKQNKRVTDKRVLLLMNNILATQQKEIDDMKDWLSLQ